MEALFTPTKTSSSFFSFLQGEGFEYIIKVQGAGAKCINCFAFQNVNLPRVIDHFSTNSSLYKLGFQPNIDILIA